MVDSADKARNNHVALVLGGLCLVAVAALSALLGPHWGTGQGLRIAFWITVAGFLLFGVWLMILGSLRVHLLQQQEIARIAAPTMQAMTHSSSKTIGVIIVDHGSVRDQSNQLLEQVVAQFRTQSGYPIVEPAHMELAEPGIAAAFDQCVAQGAGHIVVIPYFLGPGKHWDTDIPNLTADAASRHNGVTFEIAAPIGTHDLMQDVIAARLSECLDKDAGT